MAGIYDEAKMWAYAGNKGLQMILPQLDELQFDSDRGAGLLGKQPIECCFFPGLVYLQNILQNVNTINFVCI